MSMKKHDGKFSIALRVKAVSLNNFIYFLIYKTFLTS